MNIHKNREQLYITYMCVPQLPSCFRQDTMSLCLLLRHKGWVLACHPVLV